MPRHCKDAAVVSTLADAPDHRIFRRPPRRTGPASQPDSSTRQLARRAARIIEHDAINLCTPRWRMLPRVIGGLGGRLGFIRDACASFRAT
jgi:hypothetical protein